MNPPRIISQKALEAKKADVFPREVRESLDKRDVLPSPSSFPTLSDHQPIVAYIIFLKATLVYYYRLSLTSALKKHFNDTMGYLMTPQSYVRKNWASAKKRLEKSIVLRKNINQRTCFKYGESFFLTKKHFTFGQRIVEPGTQHVIQVSNRPFSVFLLKESSHATIQYKLFKMEEQFYYDQKILAVNGVYILPTGTIYVLITTERTFFALHIVKTGAPLPFANPITLKVQNQAYMPEDFYKFPVQTPIIEQTSSPTETDSDSPSEDGISAAEFPVLSPEPVASEPPAPPEPVASEPPAPPEPVASEPAAPPEPVASEPAASQLPEPPASSSPVVLIKTYFQRQAPLERIVNVVYPDLMAHYQHFFRKVYKDPKEGYVEYEAEDTPALDLSMKSLARERSESPEIIFLEDESSSRSVSPAATVIQPPQQDVPRPTVIQESLQDVPNAAPSRSTVINTPLEQENTAAPSRSTVINTPLEQENTAAPSRLTPSQEQENTAARSRLTPSLEQVDDAALSRLTQSLEQEGFSDFPDHTQGMELDRLLHLLHEAPSTSGSFLPIVSWETPTSCPVNPCTFQPPFPAHPPLQVEPFIPTTTVYSGQPSSDSVSSQNLNYIFQIPTQEPSNINDYFNEFFNVNLNKS